jgi:hypothetical protein
MHDLISTVFFHTQHSTKSFPPFFLSLIQTTTFSKFIYFSILCFTFTILSYSYIFPIPVFWIPGFQRSPNAICKSKTIYNVLPPSSNSCHCSFLHFSQNIYHSHFSNASLSLSSSLRVNPSFPLLKFCEQRQSH